MFHQMARNGVLGKITKFLRLHHLKVHKVPFFLVASRVWVFPPAMIVHTTQAAFFLEQNDDS